MRYQYARRSNNHHVVSVVGNTAANRRARRSEPLWRSDSEWRLLAQLGQVRADSNSEQNLRCKIFASHMLEPLTKEYAGERVLDSLIDRDPGL